MTTWVEFSAKRKEAGPGGVQYFAHDTGGGGRGKTVMVCSHIWWTEQIALAFLNAGYNVLVHWPLYLAYTNEEAFGKIDEVWGNVVRGICEVKVDVVIGGNSSGMLMHPKTGEMVHEAAGELMRKNVPLVNWWWDEVRMKPPVGRVMGPQEYMKVLGRGSIVNAIWDVDVMEELAAGYGSGEEFVGWGGLRNLMHLPLATLPEYWPHGYVPLEQRPLACCFLGNCHFDAGWVETDQDGLVTWARDVVGLKLANVRRSMRDCQKEAGWNWVLANERAKPAAPPGPPLHLKQQAMPKSSHMSGGKDEWLDFWKPWEILNAAWMHYTRNILVKAAAGHLGGKLALIGKGWEQIGLRANSEHAGDKSGVIYGQSQVSLNLFGGCVHGGMPLRPFDIGASGGLIVTHDQRELHGEGGRKALFEVGEECLAFGSAAEMVGVLEKVRREPGAFNQVALAGRRRVLGEHTWGHRVGRLMGELE